MDAVSGPPHMVRRAIGGGRWRCDDCRAEGTLAALSAIPCTAATVGPLTPEAQLAEWAAGWPACPNSRGECCPDFSCCRPALLAPAAVRMAFLHGTPEQRERLLLSFLGGMAADAGVAAHVTRGIPEKPS